MRDFAKPFRVRLAIAVLVGVVAACAEGPPMAPDAQTQSMKSLAFEVATWELDPSTGTMNFTEARSGTVVHADQGPMVAFDEAPPAEASFSDVAPERVSADYMLERLRAESGGRKAKAVFRGFGGGGTLGDRALGGTAHVSRDARTMHVSLPEGGGIRVHRMGGSGPRTRISTYDEDGIVTRVSVVRIRRRAITASSPSAGLLERALAAAEDGYCRLRTAVLPQPLSAMQTPPEQCAILADRVSLERFTFWTMAGAFGITDLAALTTCATAWPAGLICLGVVGFEGVLLIAQWSQWQLAVREFELSCSETGSESPGGGEDVLPDGGCEQERWCLIDYDNNWEYCWTQERCG